MRRASAAAAVALVLAMLSEGPLVSARDRPVPVPGEPYVLVDFQWPEQFVFVSFFIGPIDGAVPFVSTVDDHGAGCTSFPSGAAARSLVLGSSDAGSVAPGEYAVLAD